MDKKKFEYKYDKKLNIVFKYYYGEINLNDIESSWIYAFDNFLFPKGTKRYVLDYKKARIIIKTEETSSISKFYSEHLEYFRGAKIAIVMENPKQIVFPYLVMRDDNQYISRPFSSIEEAIKWVMM